MEEQVRILGCFAMAAGLISLATSCELVGGIQETTLALDGASGPVDGSETNTDAAHTDAGATDAAGPSCMSGLLCDTGKPCELGATQCVNGEEICMSLGLAPEGAICRPVAGPCDVAETCTGSSAACPEDGFRPSSHGCRGIAGSCDVAETCTGSSAACPEDRFRPSSHVCRNASNSTCDVAETCTGSSAACPPDLHRSDGAACQGEWSCAEYACSSGRCSIARDLCGAYAQCTSSGCLCEEDSPDHCIIPEEPTI